MSGARGASTIATPRLVLRPLAWADAGAIVTGIDDLEVSRWMVLPPHPYTQADAEEFLAYAAGRADHWTILREGAFIGVISTDGELGYWLARPVWGQGIATEAVRAVLECHFADPAQESLRANHFAENTASARVLAKAGFIYTGERLRKRSRATGAEVESLCMNLSRAHWRVLM